ncbi:hypothetical protein [Bosea sp. (in: a-proteobacteria)]|uniref:hypothetical protein n=1 Tax=Bosea sp. (in: a-proteobacteria) TaxID=1871050 RepID=UPI0031FF0F2E
MVAHASICRRLKNFALTSMTTWLLLSNQAGAQTVKIVGIGATSCQYFARETNGQPDVEKNFFAWAQGYMSGLLLRAPPGVDDDLDLDPAVFPLLKQIEFLRNFCLRNPDADFSDGVYELYRTLRAPPS